MDSRTSKVLPKLPKWYNVLNQNFTTPPVIAMMKKVMITTELDMNVIQHNKAIQFTNKKLIQINCTMQVNSV